MINSEPLWDKFLWFGPDVGVIMQRHHRYSRCHAFRDEDSTKSCVPLTLTIYP